MKLIIAILFTNLLLADSIQVTTAPVTVTYSQSPATPGAPHWCLVHDGVKVIQLFSTVGKTMTINQLFCATTEAEVQAQVVALKLIPLPAKVGPVK